MPNLPREVVGKPTLQEIVDHKRRELGQRIRAVPLEKVQASCAPCRSKFLQSLSGAGVRLIAEIKPRSPSQGELMPSVDLPSTTRLFSKYARCISVLTDEKYFGGSLQALRTVCQLAAVPVLCKEFVVDPYQVFEARAAGAEAVLLIVKILDDDALAVLHKSIRQLGMTPVVEVQREEELQRALKLSPEVLLINNRNLETFEIDLSTTHRLARLVPDGLPVISASGFETKADVEKVMTCTNKFLIGSSLMRCGNTQDTETSLAKIEAKLVELCAAS